MPRPRRALALVAVAAVGGCVSHAPSAAAATTPVTIDDRSPSLTEKDDGGWTVALGLTNLTDAPIELVARPTVADVGCEPKPLADLRDAQHTAVTVQLPAGCKIPSDGVDLELVATPREGEPVTFQVTAAPKPGPDPNWDHLSVFPIVFLIGLVCLSIAAWTQAPAQEFVNGLPHLQATWNFKDSWASNVTVAGGVLTGVLGSSDVLEPIFGKDADPAVALATVGAAVAVALAGAGAIVALALRRKSQDGARTLFTPAALALAGAVTIAAAGGELYVVWQAAKDLDLGWFKDKSLTPATAIMGALLATYAVRSLRATIREGQTPPPDPPTVERALRVRVTKETVTDEDVQRVVEQPSDVLVQYVAAPTRAAALL